MTAAPVTAGPLAAVPLGAQPVCAQDTGSWCARVYRVTGNDLLSRYADTVITRGFQILLIVALAVLCRLLVHRAIRRLIEVTAEGAPPGLLRTHREGATAEPKRTSERRAARARAIGSVLRSASTVVIYGVAFTMVLGQLGVDLGPIIASAGVVGIALGFGAQNLVKDFLSGIFMMVEDQYGVGDTVNLGEASGTVEAVGLRVSTLRDGNGTVWYVRNGEVLRVGNSSQGHAVAVVDLPIGYGADIPTATEVAGRVAAEVAGPDGALADDVLAPPEVLGVESISAEVVTLRLTVKVRAGRQWAVQRALLAAVKEAFDDAGIPPPSATPQTP
ncbi:MAG TPA: mechanosensitive ion channel family protein [Pseudonocardiaceae bacterium]